MKNNTTSFILLSLLLYGSPPYSHLLTLFVNAFGYLPFNANCLVICHFNPLSSACNTSSIVCSKNHRMHHICGRKEYLLSCKERQCVLEAACGKDPYHLEKMHHIHPLAYIGSKRKMQLYLVQTHTSTDRPQETPFYFVTIHKAHLPWHSLKISFIRVAVHTKYLHGAYGQSVKGEMPCHCLVQSVALYSLIIANQTRTKFYGIYYIN